MFGRASEVKSLSVVKATSENRFSLPYLRKLHNQLVENKVVTADNQDVVIEILRIIAEMVVYGDNKSEILFDFFCEKNMLSLFLELMSTEGGCPNAVHIQILQTLSILISCVKNNTSLYYLLSNNYVNEIINFPHNFEADESLRDQFASFMKSVSLRLNKQTVQFFFIEETGGFPILTRAIDLLYLNDNMVRIASQTTILNIYRVQDFRSRAYALQEDVLTTLFTSVSRLIITQYKLLLQICEQYLAVSNGGGTFDADSKADDEATTRAKLSSLENHLTDLLVQSEDWLYYVQDMFDLKIMSMRRALVNHLMNSFIFPILFPNISTNVSFQASSPTAAGEEDSTSLPTSEHVDEVVNQSNEIALVVSIAYLSQILRVVSDSMLRRTVLTALLHPLSRTCRRSIISAIAKQNDANEASECYALEPISFEENTARMGFVQLFEDCLEKYEDIENPVCAGGIDSLSMEESGEATPEAAEGSDSPTDPTPTTDGQQQSISNTKPTESEVERIVRALTAISVWPWHGQCRERHDRNHGENVAAQGEAEGHVQPNTAASVDLPSLRFSKSSTPFQSSPLPRSRKSWGSSMSGTGKSKSDYYDEDESEEHVGEPDDLDAPCDSYIPDCDAMHIDVLTAVHEVGSKLSPRSLVSISGAASTLNAVHFPKCFLEELAGMVSSPEYPLCALQESVHAIYGFASIAYYASRRLPSVRGTHLRYCLELVRNCGRQLGKRLLSRMSTPMGDLLLNLLQEELHRIRDRKWSTISNQISKDLLLLIPTLPTHFRSQSTDLESNVPVTQNETARREIQSFILVRSLYKQIFLMYEAGDAPNSVKISFDDITIKAIDDTLKGLTDRGLIPPHLQNGQQFDMRGKKFLDALVYTARPATGSAGASSVASPGRPSTQSGALSAEESSTLLAASIFGFGFLGNSAVASDALSPTQVPQPQQGQSRSASAGGSGAEGKRKGKSSGKVGEILFVQSPALFLLVEPRDDEFFVWLAAPIHQTDVSVTQSKKKLIVFVRSWEQVEHMELVGSEIEGISGNTQQNKKNMELLRPRQQVSLYRLTMLFDSENSCHLAAQHIESKRLKMRSNRLLYFKAILEAWAREDNSQPLVEPKDNVKVA